jgi:hypothetical protein
LQNIALERIRYFVRQELDSSILINCQYQDQCRLLATAGLKVTTLPQEPVDQIVGIMLYLKLNAIAEGQLIVNEVSVSSELGDNIVYMHCEEESVGPFDHVGWWTQSDLVHCDNELFDGGNVVVINTQRGWREVDLDWPDANINKENDNTVIFETPSKK